MFDKVTIKGAEATPQMWEIFNTALPNYADYTAKQQEELQQIWFGLKGFRVTGNSDKYRQADAWANSDLGNVRDHLMGIADTAKPYKAFALGSLFHAVALGQLPTECVSLLTPAVERDLRIMHNNYKPHHLTTTQNPVMYEVEGFKTVRGVPMKAKADIWQPIEKCVTDIKTTSCYSYQDFVETCHKYEYFRQAAHYCDVFGATKFRFIAVQKRKPFNVWVLKFGSRNKLVEEGRTKYRFLIDKAQSLGCELPSQFYQFKKQEEITFVNLKTDIL